MRESQRRAKSARHQAAAQARWARRLADDTPPRTMDDARRPLVLQLACCGGRDLLIEPVPGKIAWRCRDMASGDVVDRGALKTLLHRIADELPRTQAFH